MINTMLNGNKGLYTINIITTFNNIIINFCDSIGNVISWSSAGKMKYKGSKKNSSYAGQSVAQDIVVKILNLGIKVICINTIGPGNGRNAAIKTIANSGINIVYIKDKTPIPYNGCRPTKKRRI